MAVQPTGNQEQINTENAKANDEESNLVKQRKYYERQLDQERQARMQAEEKAAQIAKATIQTEDDDDPSDEPYVDHKRLNRKFSKFEKTMEQTIERKAEEKALKLIEEERKRHYLRDNADFAEVMKPEVVQRFAEKHPNLAENLVAMPDNFERQRLIYETIKTLGVHKPPVNEPSIQQKIDANRKSPYYQPSGISNPPFSGGGDFSQQGQKSAYDKMKELQSRLRI